MPIAKWRGVWYVYNHVTGEFFVKMNRDKMQWTQASKYAQIYKNPSKAQKCATRLNGMLHHPGCPCWPCQPVSVVTGEAARCLDAIKRRTSSDRLRRPPDARRLARAYGPPEGEGFWEGTREGSK